MEKRDTNYVKICRACLRKYIKAKYPVKRNFAAIMQSLSLINKNDPYPTNVCNKCSSDIIKVYNFKMNVEKAEINLETYIGPLNTSNIDEVTIDQEEIISVYICVDDYECDNVDDIRNSERREDVDVNRNDLDILSIINSFDSEDESEEVIVNNAAALKKMSRKDARCKGSSGNISCCDLNNQRNNIWGYTYRLS